MTVWVRKLHASMPIAECADDREVLTYPSEETRALSTLAIGEMFFYEGSGDGFYTIAQVVGDPAMTGPLWVWVREKTNGTFHRLSTEGEVAVGDRWVRVPSLSKGDEFSLFVNGDYALAELGSPPSDAV